MEVTICNTLGTIIYKVRLLANQDQLIPTDLPVGIYHSRRV